MNRKTIHSACALLVLLIIILASNNVHADVMKASWYGSGLQGNQMANGNTFNMNDPTTVAHRNFPLGAKLLLINTENNRQLTVIVKDRGPFKIGRDIDLSKAAAQSLGLKFNQNGVAEIIVFRLS